MWSPEQVENGGGGARERSASKPGGAVFRVGRDEAEDVEVVVGRICRHRAGSSSHQLTDLVVDGVEEHCLVSVINLEQLAFRHPFLGCVELGRESVEPSDI
jgi:hypothetical protein